MCSQTSSPQCPPAPRAKLRRARAQVRAPPLGSRRPSARLCQRPPSPPPSSRMQDPDLNATGAGQLARVVIAPSHPERHLLRLLPGGRILCASPRAGLRVKGLDEVCRWHRELSSSRTEALGNTSGPIESNASSRSRSHEAHRAARAAWTRRWAPRTLSPPAPQDSLCEPADRGLIDEGGSPAPDRTAVAARGRLSVR